MYFSVKNVFALDNYKLLITFENNEKKVFDMSPYLEIGKFAELKENTMFQSVHVSFDSIEWANKLDLDPELLYSKGVEV